MDLTAGLLSFLGGHPDPHENNLPTTGTGIAIAILDRAEALTIILEQAEASNKVFQCPHCVENMLKDVYLGKFQSKSDFANFLLSDLEVPIASEFIDIDSYADTLFADNSKFIAIASRNEIHVFDRHKFDGVVEAMKKKED